jgi:hypothetical protein
VSQSIVLRANLRIHDNDIICVSISRLIEMIEWFAIRVHRIDKFVEFKAV